MRGIDVANRLQAQNQRRQWVAFRLKRKPIDPTGKSVTDRSTRSNMLKAHCVRATAEYPPVAGDYVYLFPRMQEESGKL
jgi:hypothetical protein